MRLLLVEDDPRLSKILLKFLKNEGYSVDHIADGLKAQEKILATDYDVVVLDLTLPSRDGMKVTRKVREAGNTTPILILTGRDAVEDRIKGLNNGADDYLIKPFNANELIARLQALMRRPRRNLPLIYKVGDLVLDPAEHTVTRNGKEVNLMPKEYSLLEYLMREPGKARKKHEILAHVWGIYSNNSSNRLEVYIKYLREKVDGDHPKKYIKTVRGIGYKISED